MSERHESDGTETWYEPTGLAGLAHAPAHLTWWLIAEHLGELRWALRDLGMTRAAQQRIMRLVSVHAHELAVLHGCPPPETLLAASEAARAARAAEQGGSYEPGSDGEPGERAQGSDETS